MKRRTWTWMDAFEVSYIGAAALVLLAMLGTKLYLGTY